MMWILLMLAAGMLLSAFFSGSETGFYRVTRVRLVLDGRGGDPVARALLWLTNNPSLFVATTLIGNNLANYLTSLAIVLAVQLIVHGQSYLAELLAPILLAPILFIFGELLPKNLFFHAPNLLLRRAGPFFLLCTILFAPASALLWALGRGLRYVLGKSPDLVRLTLARYELARVLEEGQAAGILRPIQQKLSQGLFAEANRTVKNFYTPIARAVAVSSDADKDEVLRLAQRREATEVVVLGDGSRSRQLAGYVRTVDLYVDPGKKIGTIRPLMTVAETETHIAVLIRMQTAEQRIAQVIDENGKTVGLLSIDQLTDPMFRET